MCVCVCVLVVVVVVGYAGWKSAGAERVVMAFRGWRWRIWWLGMHPSLPIFTGHETAIHNGNGEPATLETTHTHFHDMGAGLYR